MRLPEFHNPEIQSQLRCHLHQCLDKFWPFRIVLYSVNAQRWRESDWILQSRFMSSRQQRQKCIFLLYMAADIDRQATLLKWLFIWLLCKQQNLQIGQTFNGTKRGKVFLTGQLREVLCRSEQTAVRLFAAWIATPSLSVLMDSADWHLPLPLQFI